jgi:YbbR domain-containing protein
MSEDTGIKTKMSMMALSVFAAFVFWVLVEFNQPLGASIERVPVTLLNLDTKRFMVPELNPVSVRIEAPDDQLEHIDEIRQKIRVFADLADVSPGRNWCNVRMQATEQNPRVKLTLTQSVIPVDIRQRVRARLPVIVETEGEFKRSRGFVYQGATVDPDRVAVEGSAEDVQRVSRLRVLLDLRTLQPGVSVPQVVEAIGDNDEPVATVHMTPQSVAVQPKFSTAPGARMLSVTPKFEGRLAVGFERAGYSIEPSQVAVQGTPSVVNRLEAISTKPVSLKGLRASAPIQVDLDVPAGVRLLSDPSVVVRVMVRPKHAGANSKP